MLSTFVSYKYSMAFTFYHKKHSLVKQMLISILVIGTVSTICYLLNEFIDYKVVALLLLVCVSLIAMAFQIIPVLLSAILSALIWDYFFIPPKFTFHVDSADDSLLLAMYFIIALLNGVLTYKIRQAEKEIVEKEEKSKSVKLYNVFLNSLSHELRTPISTIIGATDNLETNGDKLTEENKKYLVSEISKASLRLNKQVENLLNMSRLESGFLQLKKDWCDMNELLYSVSERLSEELSTHKVIIDTGENNVLFKLDRVIIEQVVNNLLINAANYTPPNSIIKITVQAKENRMILMIEDNGPGFHPDEITLVFDKFFRSNKNKSGGTGLGLSIVKGFVEAHNGMVSLFNIPSGGARFIIDISCETSIIKEKLK